MFSLPVSRFVSIRSCDVGWPDGVHVVSLIVGFRCFVWKLLICSVHAADQRHASVVSGLFWSVLATEPTELSGKHTRAGDSF